ncbi:hypothetical protein D1007_60271 [Hordeum vulgare]|nr:hypothetical protein D1007_60271 [Hordeum vulgare]
MGHIYTKIDPSTMILVMGESNKKLHITSDSIHHLFGFPQGDSTPPRPLEDGFYDAVMRLNAKLGYKRSADIKTKDLRNILKDLVKDEKNDDLALHVFYLILFMKLLVADLKRVLISYQQGTTRRKVVRSCGIAPLHMYLDCLVHGKKPLVDLRTPRINFMDQGKLGELVPADLVKKGDDDPTN